MAPKTGNFLDQAVGHLREQLKELDHQRATIEEAIERLTGRRRGPGRPRGSTKRRGPTRRRRRGGTRSDEAVKLVAANPGITASDVAKKMGIQPNYVYRVLGDLQKEKRVRKRGKGYIPA